MTNTDTLLALDSLAVAMKALGDSGDSRLGQAYEATETELRRALRLVLGSDGDADRVVEMVRGGSGDLLSAVQYVSRT